MPRTTRIRGNSIVLTLGGVDYSLDATSIEFSQDDAEDDFLSFADAKAGGLYEWKCEITGAQDTTSGALWRLFYDSAGTTVNYVMQQYGNATPTVAQPHVIGTMILPYKKPNIGGEAGTANTWTFDAECKVPTLSFKTS